MTIVRTSALVLFLAASACTAKRPDATQDTQPAPTDASPALTAAHEAYLTGDFVEMGERLKDVIVDPRTGELARDNAFALLDSAFDATRGQLPARTAIPKDVSVISLGVMNSVNTFGPYRSIYFYMRVAEGRAAHVKDVRVTRLPSEPILSLSEKRGTVTITPAPKGFEEVKLEARNLEVLPDRGAFGIQVVFDDAPGIDTFVLANKMVASAQPELIAPVVGQVWHDSHPEIAWHPFRSPEHAPWEPGGMSLAVSRDTTKQRAFSFYKWEPGELGSVRVTEALEPDAYWLSLFCYEERMFGGIRLQRASETGRSFTVAR